MATIMTENQKTDKIRQAVEAIKRLGPLPPVRIYEAAKDDDKLRAAVEAIRREREHGRAD